MPEPNDQELDCKNDAPSKPAEKISLRGEEAQFMERAAQNVKERKAYQENTDGRPTGVATDNFGRVQIEDDNKVLVKGARALHERKAPNDKSSDGEAPPLAQRAEVVPMQQSPALGDMKAQIGGSGGASGMNPTDVNSPSGSERQVVPPPHHAVVEAGMATMRGAQVGFDAGQISLSRNVAEADPSIAGRVEKTDDGGTRITDAKGNSKTTWPDGSIKRENGDGTGFMRRPDGLGGYTEQHWGKLARDNFEVRDVGSERKQLDELAEKAFQNHPEELQRFKENMKRFEARAEAGPLPPVEVARTYQEISRLLEHRGETPTTAEERSALAGQVMAQAANPTSVDQGYHNTCNVATVEARVYTKTPSEAARLVTQVATTGQFVAYDGTVVLVNPKGHDTSNDRIPKDGDRSHASEMFQVAAVNLHYAHENARTDPPGQVFYEQEEAKPGTEGTGESLRDYGKRPPKTLSDSPYLVDGSLTEISNTITGKNERGIVIADARYLAVDEGKVNPSHDVRTITGTTELAKVLEQAKKDDKLPIIIKVNTEMPPFYQDSGAGSAGGSGGAHVVTVTDYIPGNPPKVKLDNQWGSAGDHTKDGTEVSLHELYRAMRAGDDLVPGLKKEVELNKQNGNVDSSLEFQLLRIERTNENITERQYVDGLSQVVRESQARWEMQRKEGKLDPEEVSKGQVEFASALANLSPPDKIKVLAVANQSGMLEDGKFEAELAVAVYKAGINFDLQRTSGEFKDKDSKVFFQTMRTFWQTVESLPEERQERVRQALFRLEER